MTAPLVAFAFKDERPAPPVTVVSARRRQNGGVPPVRSLPSCDSERERSAPAAPAVGAGLRGSRTPPVSPPSDALGGRAGHRPPRRTAPSSLVRRARRVPCRCILARLTDLGLVPPTRRPDRRPEDSFEPAHETIISDHGRLRLWSRRPLRARGAAGTR